MFGLSSSLNYYLYPGYVNMIGGIDVLYDLIRAKMPHASLDSAVYIFISKNRRSVKLLHWENGGFTLYHRRLVERRFKLPRFYPREGLREIEWKTFIFFMEGVDPSLHKL